MDRFFSSLFSLLSSFPNSVLALIFPVLLIASPFLAAQDLADVIEQSEKSVVRIEVKGLDGGGLGSGFVVSKNGLLVTNVHVLAGAEKAIASFPNGKSYEITGTLHIDEGRDICVAKIELPGAIPIKLASNLPRKGETVTALGSPLGLSFTATTGIISAIRSGTDLGKDIGDSSMKGTWVQVDAALSPGNSGGPLINSKGEVVAMSTRASQGIAQNLNFGISIVDIRAAIVKAESARKIAFADGVGKIKDYEVGAGDSSSSIVKRREVPESSLQKYVQEGRDSFKDLSTQVRRSATEAEKEWRDMKKGEPYIPAQYDSGSSIVAVMGRTSKKYYFRSETVKKRVVKEKEERKNELKKLKTQLQDSSEKSALHALLSKAGPALDPQDPKSVGFLNGARVLHAYNDHEIAVLYDGSPYLMWVESSAGLSGGQELAAIPAFVAGTETVLIPGRTTMSVTVLQAISDRELEKAVLGESKQEQFQIWSDVTGKHQIEAAFIKNDGKKVHLKKRDGSTIEVDLSRLDQKSRDAANEK